MKFKRHIPSFVDAEASEHEYNTEQEFLVLDCIKDFTIIKGFKRFSISPYKFYFDPDTLMAEFDNGYFFVIGYLEKEHGLTFPKWESNI